MLPSPLTSFIGRELECEALASLLATARLVTVLGPGGVGKTRLALQVAGQIAPRFPGGVRFVDLTPLTDPGQVLPALARAVEIGDGAAEAPMLERLAAALSGRRLLLLLDNFERLLAAAPDLAALLAAAPGLTALVTSRVALSISGEREFALGPLALPVLPADSPAPLAAAASPAVRLFVERAAAVRPSLALNAANAATVAAICARLDGLPLAIELAAARARALAPAEILARLDRRLPLLRGGPQDRPARQRSLRDTIAWSYDLLSEPERRLLRALAVFSGGWSLAAVVAVCAEPGEDELTLLDLLAALVAHSLVQMRELAGAPRYLMLETLREYAAEQLAADPAEPTLRARHAAWARELARQAQDGLIGPDQRAWYEVVEQEHDNLRAALGWALAHDPALAAAIAWPLWRFWWQRGYAAEGRAWLDRALAAAPPALGPAGEPTAQALTVAQALHSAGTLAWAEADYEAALAHYRQSLEIRRAIGDQQLIVRGQFSVAKALANLERYDEALPLYLACLEYEQRHGLFEDMVGTLNNTGYIHQQRGNHEAAYRYYHEAATLSRRFADAARTAQKLVFAAEALLELGRSAEALPLIVEGLQLAQGSGGHLVLIEALEGAACVLAAEGDAARAVRLLGAAEAARRRRGIVLSPDDYPRLVRAARRAHGQLGGAEFARLWAGAGELEIEAAVRLALAPPAAPMLPAPPGGPVLDDAVLEISPRERDVLALLAAGLSDRQIAARLIIGVSTVNSHVKSIYSKLGVRSRVAAARFAIERGLAADLETDAEG